MSAASGAAALSPAQYARAKALFNVLVELPAAERSRRLAEPLDDPAVDAELRRLLAHATATLASAPLDQALQGLVEAPKPGDTLGTWTLEAPIGAGGMGQVFRAQRSDGHFRQQAAIKFLAGLPSAAALRFLARERQILATLAHPNIARLLDGGSTPAGQPYLVMEYVDGQPLLGWCRQQSLTVPARLRLLIDICGAVAFAHRQLVVHCDLKPGNVLVSPDGRPMLLDFGISRLLDEAENAVPVDGSATVDAGQTAMAYTPRYASPEQKAGRRVGTATDVYSLGLMLAELLEVPWPEDGAPQLRGLPEELAAIIERATASEPERRYANVDALAEDLRRYLAQEVVRARRPTPGYLARKWLRRHRWPVAVGSAFVLLLSGFSWQMRAERDSARQAEAAARAVKDFMVGVFQGADPELAGRRDLPVSQVLDAGSERLRGSLAEQPATRAELAIILGAVYQNIGRREQALAHFDEGVALARQIGAPALLADGLHRKAYTLYDQEALSEALPVAREALRLRGDAEAGSSAHLASLRLLGSILSYLGESAEAGATLEQALTLASTTHGAESLEAALAHLDLARHFGGMGDQPATVQEHAERAGALFAAQLGPEHIRVADALEMRILGMVQAGKAGAALPLADQLVARRAALYGEQSLPHSYALQVQGSVRRSAGQHLAAIPSFRASLAIHDALDGPQAPSRLVPSFNLARVLEETGNHAEALRQFEQHHAIQTAHPEGANVPMSRIELHLGRNLRLLGQREAAEAQLRALLAGPAEALAPVRAAVWLELAALAREAGALDLAGQHLNEAAAAESAPGADWHAEWARLQLARGDLAAAREALDAALAEVTAGAGADSVSAALLRIDEAQWLAASGQREAARQLAGTLRERLAPVIDPAGRHAQVLESLSR
ncbi:MAG: serine/threonine-protein kinase [Xanthomonadales bacterium]|nr:serine/threonine-protein kinase [Xanthomonadales bacterium]